MNEELKSAFAAVHASEELKSNTCKAISLAAQAERRRVKNRPARVARVLVAACCLVLMLWGGYYFALEPVAAISLDVNPSLQLSINRLDRVISLEGQNSDGQYLAQSLDVVMEPYTQALEEILDCGEIQACLSRQEPVSITVSAADQEKTSQLLTAVEGCAGRHQGVYCGALTSSDAADAAAAGVSMGRYRAYLLLRQLNPTVTLEDIQNLSMGEIRRWIADLQGDDSLSQGGASSSGSFGSPGGSGDSNGSGGPHYGQENGHGWQWGRSDGQ